MLAKVYHGTRMRTYQGIEWLLLLPSHCSPHFESSPISFLDAYRKQVSVKFKRTFPKIVANKSCLPSESLLHIVVQRNSIFLHICIQIICKTFSEQNSKEKGIIWVHSQALDTGSEHFGNLHELIKVIPPLKKRFLTENLICDQLSKPLN